RERGRSGSGRERRGTRPRARGPRGARLPARGARSVKRARALLAAALLAGCTAAPAPPPSVILILVDDLGWADLGVHGSPDVVTPNIDSIARDGTRFTA